MLILPTDMRQTSYHNVIVDPETEEKFTKVSSGSEFIIEYKTCGACAGVEAKIPTKPNHTGHINIMRGMQAHAKLCKKKFDECGHCQENVEFFKSIPLVTINLGLTDPMTKPMKVSMAYTVVENMLRRSKHTSMRSKADFNVSYPILKQYEERGGSL